MTQAIAWGVKADPPPYPSLARALAGEVARLPDGQFFHAKRDGGLVAVRYPVIFERATRLAGAMRTAGLSDGDRLIINLPDSEEFVPALWGAILAGLVVLPLAHGASREVGAVRRREVLGFACEALGNATVLTDDPDVRGLVPGADVLLFADLDRGGDALVADGPNPISKRCASPS